MAKRKRQVVVLSDDDEDRGVADRALPQCRHSCEPSFAMLPVPDNSQATISPFKKIEEDMAFLHMETDSNAFKGCRRISFQESLWVDKFRPKSLADLAVHSKKVAEVRGWVEAQLGNPLGSQFPSRVLLLTGPTGVGKKSVVRVLADTMSFDLTEWTAPTPVLWKEYLHNTSIGSNYRSKLDEFEAFVESSRKYPSLPVNTEGNARGSKVILIDDLPLVNGEDKKQQLCQSLYRLVVGAQFPTIVVITDVAEDGHDMTRYMGDIQQTIERGGAAKIAFNPITVNATKKVLTNILKEEKCHVPSEVVSEVAEIAAGDVRHAILSLQFLCVGRQTAAGKARQNNSKVRRKNLSAKQARRQILPVAVCGDDEDYHRESYELKAGRDETLSLFHALGKFLHNKRHTDASPESGERLHCPLQQEHRRHPLKMAEPEMIITQAHAEASTLIAFFHENALEFVDDEAIDDTAEIMTYLSDADFLAARFSWQSRKSGNCGWSDSLQLAEAAAASVAARGVLFANAHPAPRRWQTLRSPVVWQIERTLANKKLEMFGARGQSRIAQATERIPFLRSISSRVIFKEDPTQFPQEHEDDEIEEW